MFGYFRFLLALNYSETEPWLLMAFDGPAPGIRTSDGFGAAPDAWLTSDRLEIRGFRRLHIRCIRKDIHLLIPSIPSASVSEGLRKPRMPAALRTLDFKQM